MQLNFNGIDYVVGSAPVLEGMATVKPLVPFDDTVIEFLNDLSVKLRGNRAFSDIATFGFWCRKGAVLKQKEQYDDIHKRLGRGVVFHIAPTNVPVNFAFSFVSGLLAGNANIIRLSKKPFEQIDIICGAINALLDEKYEALRPYICMIRYDHNKEITDAVSDLCDVRVIWGGDRTIAEIRKSPIKARTTEINFADRHSMAVINAEKYLECETKDRLISDFYNDTYFSDQNACTSPRILFWMGEKTEEAKKDFWDRVDKLVKEKYSFAAVQAVGKLSAFYKAAAGYDIRLEESKDMYITRMDIDAIDGGLMDYKYNSGFFFEKNITSLSEMAPVCTKPCQTITYYGLEKEELEGFLMDCRPRGVDRIVPIGKSMDFELIWDGYDLIRGMSRRIGII